MANSFSGVQIVNNRLRSVGRVTSPWLVGLSAAAAVSSSVGEESLSKQVNRAIAEQRNFKPTDDGPSAISARASSPDFPSLQDRLEDIVKKVGWCQQRGITKEKLRKPGAQFALHIGWHVIHSSLPHALYRCYNETDLGKAILGRRRFTVYPLPVDLWHPEYDELKRQKRDDEIYKRSREELTRVLAQALAHPKVIRITVTKPFKNIITDPEFDFIDNWDPEVRQLNTTNNLSISRRFGRPRVQASNTDGLAFVNAFRAFWPSSRQGKQLAESRSLPEGETQGKNIVILGFGGTGMAVLNAIVRQHSMHGMKLAPSIMAHPNDITIGYRPGSRKAVQQAWQTVKGNFIDDLGPTDNPILAEVFELGRGSDSWLDALVEFIPINSSEMRQKMKQAHIIINTTPVGMDKESKDTAAVKNLNGVFKRKPGEYLVVIDVIHRSTQGKPLATYFLRQAWRQGARAVYNGVDMWLENTVLLTLSSLRDIAELKPKSKRYAAEEEAFARQVYGYSMQASQFAEAADLIEASGRRTRQNKKEKLDWMVKRRNEIIDQAASSAIAASAAERKKIELAAAITRRVLAPYKDLNSMYHCPMHAMLTIYILARMGILALAAYSKQHGHLCPMVTATRDLVDVFPQRAQPASRDKNQAVMIISRQSSQKNPYYRSFKPLENNSGMVRRFKAYLDSVVLHCYQPVIDEILEKSRGRRPGSKNFDFEIIISQAEVKNSLVPALVQRNDDYADAVIDSLLKAMDTAGEKEKAGFSRKLELVIALHSEGPGRQPGPGRSSSSARSSTTLSEKVSQLQRDFQWKAPRPFKDCLSPELIAEWIAIAGRGEVELDRVISVFYRTRRGDSNLENSLFSQALSR
ncbi:MAG: hypothetical protein KJ977_03235, partial [Candidatus Omnitrophica bacterium]|nr:hypothetical protein [Candidatus Omnitrophota bacterium]